MLFWRCDMVRVYGCGDDLVIIEGPTPKEINCYRKSVAIEFVDGTAIEIRYPKKKIGVWEITLLKRGTAPFVLIPCYDENADLYSDIFSIDSKLKTYTVEDVE